MGGERLSLGDAVERWPLGHSSGPSDNSLPPYERSAVGPSETILPALHRHPLTAIKRKKREKVADFVFIVGQNPSLSLIFLLLSREPLSL